MMPYGAEVACREDRANQLKVHTQCTGPTRVSTHSGIYTERDMQRRYTAGYTQSVWPKPHSAVTHTSSAWVMLQDGIGVCLLNRSITSRFFFFFLGNQYAGDGGP
jgi:hypothetical protein